VPISNFQHEDRISNVKIQMSNECQMAKYQKFFCHLVFGFYLNFEL
jgi:hypothetical protein